MFCLFFSKVETEEDFSNTPFHPSVAKDNQMREIPQLCASVCEMWLQDNFPILVTKGLGESGKRDKAWGGEEAGRHWGLVLLLMMLLFSFFFIIIKAGLKPERTLSDHG